MESFFYSVNATAPVFLGILLGYILRRIGILDEHFVSVCNRFNFKITLPVMLFVQMTETSLRDNFSGGFVLLCAVITVLSAVGIWIGARIFLKDRHMEALLFRRDTAAVSPFSVWPWSQIFTAPAPLFL